MKTLYIGKYNLGSGTRSSINYTEQYRNPNAIDDFRIFEIYDERLTSAIDLAPTLTLDLFTRNLVQVITGVNGCGF